MPSAGRAELVDQLAPDRSANTGGPGSIWVMTGLICAPSAPQPIGPVEHLGVVPAVPQAYWGGWGVMPDQYGRRFDGDDGESPRAACACLRPHVARHIQSAYRWSSVESPKMG